MRVGPLDDARPRLLCDDAAAMERSAAVLKLRARRPRSFLVGAACWVLLDHAGKLRAEAADLERSS